MTQRHLQAACEAWTTTEYKGGSYLGISPRVFFEEVLPASFIEIKCMVFHGTTHYLYVAQALVFPPLPAFFRRTREDERTAIEGCRRNGATVPRPHRCCPLDPVAGVSMHTATSANLC